MNAYLDGTKSLNTEKHTQKVMNEYNPGIITYFIHVPLW